MALAALILSGIAVLAAIASALYARQQTAHAKRSADIAAGRWETEMDDRRRHALARQRAQLRLYVQREENLDGSLAEGPFRHRLVVTNDGLAEAREVTVAIISAWNNPHGTKARFTDGQQSCRVGRVPSLGREALPLTDDREVDFDDIGECDVRWLDDSDPNLQQALLPARPNWL